MIVCDSYNLDELRVVKVSGVSKEAVCSFLELIYTGKTQCSESEGEMLRVIFQQFGTWDRYKKIFKNILGPKEEL